MAVVADANVVLFAPIGGRARLVIASSSGPVRVATQAVAEKIARHLPRLAAGSQARSCPGTPVRSPAGPGAPATLSRDVRLTDHHES